MAKPFKNLIKKMSPKAQKRVKEKTARLMKEIALKDLREKRQITQEDVAEILQVNQSSISKIENRGSGISLGLLEKYIEALGGELELKAKFAEGSLAFSVTKSENDENRVA